MWDHELGGRLSLFLFLFFTGHQPQLCCRTILDGQVKKKEKEKIICESNARSGGTPITS